MRFFQTERSDTESHDYQQVKPHRMVISELRKKRKHSGAPRNDRRVLLAFRIRADFIDPGIGAVSVVADILQCQGIACLSPNAIGLMTIGVQDARVSYRIGCGNGEVTVALDP